MTIKKYTQALSAARKRVGYWAQITRRDFVDGLLDHMNRSGVSQAALASRVGTSPQFITKALRSNANLTIETMTKLAMAVGCKVRLHLAEQRAVTTWLDHVPDTTVTKVPLAASASSEAMTISSVNLEPRVSSVTLQAVSG